MWWPIGLDSTILSSLELFLYSNFEIYVYPTSTFTTLSDEMNSGNRHFNTLDKSYNHLFPFRSSL